MRYRSHSEDLLDSSVHAEYEGMPTPEFYINEAP